MKPFNLKEAKADAAVQTKSGHSVRLVDFGRKNTRYPITAIVDDKEIVTYTIYGSDGISEKNTLVMVPKTIVGYINYYGDYVGALHPTRSVADDNTDAARIACIKVTFTEGQFDD